MVKEKKNRYSICFLFCSDGMSEKKFVVPGEKIDEKVNAYVYRENGKIYSMIMGILSTKDDVSRLIPLAGKYLPQAGDYVVGVIEAVKHSGYVVDINSPYTAFLQSYSEYKANDVVFAKIVDVNEVKSAVLEEDKPMEGGDIIEISPYRVLRVIGKNNSMLNLLREKTKAFIVVGRNGRIWLKGGDAAKAEQAILKIEKEAHTSGLTERMEAFLSS